MRSLIVLAILSTAATPAPTDLLETENGGRITCIDGSAPEWRVPFLHNYCPEDTLLGSGPFWWLSEKEQDRRKDEPWVWPMEKFTPDFFPPFPVGCWETESCVKASKEANKRLIKQAEAVRKGRKTSPDQTRYASALIRAAKGRDASMRKWSQEATKPRPRPTNCEAVGDLMVCMGEDEPVRAIRSVDGL